MGSVTWICCAVVFFLFERAITTPVSIGQFWQVTDFHYDANYSVSGNPLDMCHNAAPSLFESPVMGKYGDYKCDSPWQLVQSAISAMKQIQPKPDFILWTGDSIPHVPNSDLDLRKIYTVIGNITLLLRDTFSNITIYPTFGNHDPWPSNQMSPDTGDRYYENIANISRWDQLLPTGAMKTFLKGGYYTDILCAGLSLINLNSPLYYHSNKLVSGIKDPAGQLDWLRQTLEQIKSRNEKVYIASHIPPGRFGRVANISWFYPYFNKAYLSILQEYKDLITGQFYGHEHTDGFRVTYDDNGTPYGSMFLSPAVTPWNSTLPGAGYNNPSIRLYHYDRNSGQVLDYFQYFLNLTAANTDEKAKWALEYQATKAYSIDKVTTMSLVQLVNKLKASGSGLFEKYYVYNSVSVDPESTCSGQCKKNHMCAIIAVDYEQYDKCLANMTSIGDDDIWPPHPPHPPLHPHHRKAPKYMLYIIIAMAVVVVAIFILIVLLCLRNTGTAPVTFRGHVPRMRHSSKSRLRSSKSRSRSRSRYCRVNSEGYDSSVPNSPVPHD